MLNSVSAARNHWTTEVCHRRPLLHNFIYEKWLQQANSQIEKAGHSWLGIGEGEGRKMELKGSDSLGGDKTVLKLNCGGGCITVNISSITGVRSL